MLYTVIQNFRITRQLGTGGMASVWQAEHVHLKGRTAAVKVLHPGMSVHEYVRKKFYGEAQALANLSHEGIVNVRDFGDHEGSLYLVMDYVSGQTLEDLIHSEAGPMPTARALKIFEHVLDAVGYAHSRGIVHRDLKPGNINSCAGTAPNKYAAHTSPHGFFQQLERHCGRDSYCACPATISPGAYQHL